MTSKSERLYRHRLDEAGHEYSALLGQKINFLSSKVPYIGFRQSNRTLSELRNMGRVFVHISKNPCTLNEMKADRTLHMKSENIQKAKESLLDLKLIKSEQDRDDHTDRKHRRMIFSIDEKTFHDTEMFFVSIPYSKEAFQKSFLEELYSKGHDVSKTQHDLERLFVIIYVREDLQNRNNELKLT